MLLHLSKITLLFLVISCGSEKVQFEPDPYIGDYITGSIVNSQGDYISAFEPRFNEYGCLHETDFKRLAAILSASRIPKRYKDILQKELDKIETKKRRARLQGSN